MSKLATFKPPVGTPGLRISGGCGVLVEAAGCGQYFNCSDQEVCSASAVHQRRWVPLSVSHCVMADNSPLQHPLHDKYRPDKTVDCVARAITAQVLINPRYCFHQHFLKCIVFRCCFGFFERRRISPSPFNPLLKLSPLLIHFTTALSSIENTLKSQRISFFNQQLSIFVLKSGDKFKEYHEYNILTIWYPLIY